MGHEYFSLNENQHRIPLVFINFASPECFRLPVSLALAIRILNINNINYSQPLQQICVRPDAQRKTNGLSPVSSEVINAVIRDPNYWSCLEQLIKTCKPLVDAIGNLESRDADLADCMLELIRCARQMLRISLEPDEDAGFWVHAKAVFNREFHAMNTSLHNLALFLHPMCQKLAVFQAAKGRSFDEVCKTALKIARQWRWDQARAGRLVEDLKQYYHCKGPFVGGQADATKWWECLEISADQHPIKALAITILAIVPHAADVERLFSDLTGVQGVKRCNLTVETFETMGKLRANYNYHLHQQARASGKSIRRRHAHMHTRNEPGLNIDLSADLETNFTWTPPLAARQTEISLDGPEAITDEELEAAFAELEQRDSTDARRLDPVIEGDEIEAGRVYDLDEFARVEKGVIPSTFEDDVEVVVPASGDTNWDIDTILLSKGVSSA